VVLQRECRASGCTPGTAGTEDIQIDWITIEIRVNIGVDKTYEPARQRHHDP